MSGTALQTPPMLTMLSQNERWGGRCVSEPVECGWAREAVFFVRAVAATRVPALVPARVQISPEGIWWADEGTTFTLPRQVGEVSVAKVRHFGSWLRLAAELPAGAGLTVTVSLHLKA